MAIHTLTLAWLLNIACWLFAVAWIFFDPLAPFGVAIYVGTDDALPYLGALRAPFSRIVIAILVWIIALLGMMLVAFGLFLGPPKHRGVRSWLAVTTLLAFWLGLVVSWRSLADAGQQWRLTRQLDSFETLAEQLRTEWPDRDGQIAGLGPFSAYPAGRPRTLLVIVADLPEDRSPIAVVERSDDGNLRFELAGDEAGAWLEWHPPGSEPASFIGGLQDERDLVDAVPLRDGWYLSRYRTRHAAAEPPPSPQENG